MRARWRFRGTQDGFTLMELLIAVLVASMMLALASTALRQMISSIDRFGDPFPTRVMPLARLRALLLATVPYAVTHADGFGGNHDKKGFFFRGDETELQWISANISPAEPTVLLRLSLQEDRLMLATTPLYHPQTDYMDPVETEHTRHDVLLQGVKTIRLRFVREEETLERLENQMPDLIFLEIELVGADKRQYVFRLRSHFPEKGTMMQVLETEA